MSGKYLVDVSRMNDVSKLLKLLWGYTKVDWELPTNYLYIDISNRITYKNLDSSLEYVNNYYKRVGYDDIISILEDESLKELGTHIEMDGKYQVDVSKLDDVSRLIESLTSCGIMLRSGINLPTEYLFIDLGSKKYYKTDMVTFNQLCNDYTLKPYHQMLDILDEYKRSMSLCKQHCDSSIELDFDYTNSNLLILNDYLKNGTKIQFNISGTQWHNVTGKFKLEQLKHKSIKLRYKPESVEVDGMMMKPDAAIKYINKHYIESYNTEADGV